MGDLTKCNYEDDLESYTEMKKCSDYLSYNMMMFRFWIWNIEKLKIKNKNIVNDEII